MKDAIKKAVQDEREICARIVDQAQGEVIGLTNNASGAVSAVQMIAARIRAPRPV